MRVRLSLTEQDDRGRVLVGKPVLGRMRKRPAGLRQLRSPQIADHTAPPNFLSTLEGKDDEP